MQRLIILVLSIVIVIQAVILWAGTGSRSVTDLPAFGLLPGTSSFGAESISLMTLAAPALLVALVAVLPDRKFRKKNA